MLEKAILSNQIEILAMLFIFIEITIMANAAFSLPKVFNAIIVGRKSSGESSFRITFLTAQYGMLNVLAKGVTQKGSSLPAVLDLLHEVEVSVTFSNKSDFLFLRDASLLKDFAGIKKNYLNFKLACYFAALEKRVAMEFQAIPQIYFLFKKALDHLNSHPASTRILHRFECRLLEVVGLRPSQEGRFTFTEIFQQNFGPLPSNRKELIEQLSRI